MSMDAGRSHIGCVDFQALVGKSQEEALHAVVDSYATVGLQAAVVGEARELLHEILWRKRAGRKVFLSYTSNLISSGLRDTFTFLAREKLVDCFISSAGGIEEDAIKCLGKTFVARFDMDGYELRKKGFNRIGNLLVPNDNYCHFEDYFVGVIKRMHERQRSSEWEEATAPSEIIAEMGRALEEQEGVDHESSLLYWCYKNDIPVFSPALTDGSIGDMIFFFNYSKKGLVVDPMVDIAKIREASAGRVDAIVLGAGLPKHFLMSNVEVSRAVIVTTGLEADGCTSACVPADDAACGLLGRQCKFVRVQGDATLIFPLLLLQHRHERTGKGSRRGKQPNRDANTEKQQWRRQRRQHKEKQQQQVQQQGEPMSSINVEKKEIKE